MDLNPHDYNMSKAKKLSLSVVFQFISIIVTGLVGILIIPLVIRFLGREYYGVLEIIISLTFINLFFEMGMGSTLLRFIPVYEKEGENELNSFLWTFLYFKSLLGIIAALIIFIIGFNFDAIFNIGQADIGIVKNAVYIFAIGLFLSNISTFVSNTLKGFQRFDLAIIPDLISQLFYLGFFYVLSMKNISVDILLVAFLMFIARPLIRLLMGLLFLKRIVPYFKLYPIKPQKRFLKESFGFLKGMSLIVLLAQFYYQAPKMIFGILANPVSVAYWGIAQRLRNPITQISTSLIRPLLPMASSMDLDEKEHIGNIIIKITKIHFLLIGGISIFIFMFARPFIEIWLGSGYQSVIDIIKITFIPFIVPNSSVLLMFYYAKGKTKLSQNMNLLNTFLGLFVGTILFLKFELVGFAVGLTLSVIIISVVYFFYLTKEFELSFWTIFHKAYLKPYLIIGLTIILNSVILKYMEISTWSDLIISVSIGFFFYLFFIFISMKKSERIYYKNLFLKKNKK